MQHPHRYQHFALDANDNLVDIRNTVAMNGKLYFCPHCHQEMITKRGNIRQWHFAHKSDKCSYDKYLHSIAEVMIMDWFNKTTSISLVMDVYERCRNYDECIFVDKKYCRRLTKVRYDLKKYYSECTKEKKYGDFVADLLCENHSNPTAPIFIEIYVTHKCSPEKKKSGIRIIEFQIQSEEDILNIINSSQITKGINVRLYNFKRKHTVGDNYGQPFQKYILHPTMKSYVDRNGYTCMNYNQHRKGIYEISMPYDECIPYFINSGGLYAVGKAKAYLDGYLKKDCQLCKWQSTDFSGDDFCRLYKKCGNPKYCKDNDALTCPMFKENKEIINCAISDFNDYMKHNQIEVWKSDLSKM